MALGSSISLELTQVCSFLWLSNSVLRFFFWYGPFLKSLLHLLQYFFCFMSWFFCFLFFFSLTACGTFALDQGSNPHPLHLEGEILTTGPSGKSPSLLKSGNISVWVSIPIHGLPWWGRLKNSPAMQETWVWSLCQEDLLENKMAIHSSILA